MSRKGVSPLIAYVLLVGLAISMAVIFANWSRQHTEKVTDMIIDENVKNDRCASVAFNFNNTHGECTDTILGISVSNRGYVHIADFKVLLDGEERDIANANPNPQVKVSETKDLNIGRVENVDEIELVPFVDINCQKVGCFDRRVKIKC